MSISYSIHFEDESNKLEESVYNYKNRIYLFEYPCVSNSECVPYKVKLERGYYLIECWGASGGNDCFNSGYSKGAYASGILYIESQRTLYFYIGGKGSDGGQTDTAATVVAGGFNDGGDGGGGGSSGGGGTDVRLTEGKLTSRIIVAGAGSGGEQCSNGHGGSLFGATGEYRGCRNGRYSRDKGSKPGGQQYGGEGGGNISDIGGSGSFGIGGNGITKPW